MREQNSGTTKDKLFKIDLKLSFNSYTSKSKFNSVTIHSSCWTKTIHFTISYFTKGCNSSMSKLILRKNKIKSVFSGSPQHIKTTGCTCCHAKQNPTRKWEISYRNCINMLAMLLLPIFYSCLSFIVIWYASYTLDVYWQINYSGE